LPRERPPEFEGGGAEADEIEEVMGEAVTVAAFVGDGEAVFLPGLIEEGDDAVIENVEEGGGGEVSTAESFADEFGVIEGQDALGPGEAHEVDFDAGGLAFDELDAFHGAGGEAHFLVDFEAGDLGAGDVEAADGGTLGGESFEQTHGLKELELVAAFGEALLEQGHTRAVGGRSFDGREI
jgi:hypothetical protein